MALKTKAARMPTTNNEELVSDFKLAEREQIYMNNTIIPPTNKITMVKNIQPNLAWANVTPTIRDLLARANDAIKGEFNDSKKIMRNLSIIHKTINLNSYFYNYYFATTYLNLRVTDNMSLF